MWRWSWCILLALLTLAIGFGETPVASPQGCVPYPKANYPQDSFGAPLKPGQVRGSSSPEGTPRLVLDNGKTRMSVDHCALRMPETSAPRFGQVGLAYPRMQRKNGRVIHFRVRPGDIQQTNGLVLGAFKEPNPANPLERANAVALDNFDNQTGTFNIGFKDAMLPTLLPQFQTPLDVYVLLREQGAVYLVDGLVGGHYAAPPRASVIGLDQSLDFAEFYPAAHSSSPLLEHRLEHFQVRDVAAWSRWYGTAHAADRLIGASGAALGQAEKGGSWRVMGNLRRGVEGVHSDAKGGMALLDPGAPSQVLGLTLRTGTRPQGVALIFRARSMQDHYAFMISSEIAQVVRVKGGQATPLQQTQAPEFLLGKNTTHYLQVLDTGPREGPFDKGGKIRLYLDGRLVFVLGDDPKVNPEFDNANADASGVGFEIGEGVAWGTVLSRFEAHPRTIALPAELRLPEPFFEERGDVVVASDRFDGAAGRLEARRTPVGGLSWEKRAPEVQGEEVVLLGNGQVQPTPREKRSDYLLYGLRWPQGYRHFASLEATLTPPGQKGRYDLEGNCTGYGEANREERLRAGFFFWQDAQHYLIVRAFIDDSQSNASELEWQAPVGGVLEVIRRVNLGPRLCHGNPFHLRVSFDGDWALAWVRAPGSPREEAVQSFRWSDAFPDQPPLKIHMVGLLFSEEDSGTRLDSFTAWGSTRLR
jgi:hypothetical protein